MSSMHGASSVSYAAMTMDLRPGHLARPVSQTAIMIRACLPIATKIFFISLRFVGFRLIDQIFFTSVFLGLFSRRQTGRNSDHVGRHATIPGETFLWGKVGYDFSEYKTRAIEPGGAQPEGVGPSRRARPWS